MAYKFVLSSDQEKPVLSCPSDIFTSNISVIWEPVTASDNSGETLVVACTHTGGDRFTSDVTYVKCYATDEADNIGQCSFTVTVGKSILHVCTSIKC